MPNFEGIKKVSLSDATTNMTLEEFETLNVN